MSAHQGESSPDVFVFPPFAPPVRPSETASPAPAAAPAPLADPDPFVFELSLPAHDIGDPDTDLPLNEPTAWGFERQPEAAPAEETSTPADEGGDLPWLELPGGEPRVHGNHAAETAAPGPAVEPGGGWMDWEGDEDATGQSASEITPPALATAGELTSVAAVPSPAMDAGSPSSAPAPEATEPLDFDAPDPFAPRTEPIHPEAMAAAEPEPAHSWPVEAMEPAALLAADEAPVVQTSVDEVGAGAPSHDHAAFEVVAERLESVARALRTDPGGFVAAHHDDPLALLIAGFALGYQQASKTTG